VKSVKDLIGLVMTDYSFKFTTTAANVTSITMPSSLVLTNGSTTSMIPVTTPLHGTLSVTNSDPTVAAYDSATGEITAKHPGVTTIAVTSVANPAIKKYCLVSVPETYTADGASFNMMCVPVTAGGITFPTGTGDGGSAIVSDAYWVGETHVTQKLWTTVYNWAVSNGYAILSAPSETYTFLGDEQTPVIWARWREDVVFCNAITAWLNAKNGTSLSFVYTTDGTTPAKTVSEVSSGITVNSAATGFRLLTANEYELAARWSSDTVNTVAAYTSYPFFTKGNSASGATASVSDTAATSLVAVMNSGSVEAVKQKSPNSLGIYDMSGNAYSFCFDDNGTKKVTKGGSMISSTGTSGLQTGYAYGELVYTQSSYTSFRLARKK
jgi:formylglycine-generating enzyme required for sulfatase activity